MGLIQDLQRVLTQKKVAKPRASKLSADLEDVRATHFPHIEQEHFASLWCEIAEILGIEPLGMRPADRVIELRPNARWPSFNAKIQNLEAFVLDESRGQPPPAKMMETVGDVVQYLTAPATSPNSKTP